MCRRWAPARLTLPFLQGLFGSYAATGTGPVTAPQKNIRSVTMLWQNVEQFVLNNDQVKTGTVGDLVALKGMSMGMGKQNSGTIGSNTRPACRARASISTRISNWFTPAMARPLTQWPTGRPLAPVCRAGPPTGAVTKLMASNAGKFTILDVTPEQA